MGDTQQGRQVVVDRLKRRLDGYRNHNSISTHHFENTVDTIYSDQRKQTQLLKQRHIESKSKKTSKKASDTKKQDSSLLGNMGQSKLLVRGHEQTTGLGDTHDNEPAAKKQRLVNGSIINTTSSNISDFEIVQQLHNIKSSSVVGQSGNLSCTDPLDVLAESALGGNESEDIKKETEIDIPNDSLLDDLGELGNFEDMDMGINLADFVHDLDLDNIKHENSNPGIDSYFKEDIGESLYDDPSNISSDCGVAVNSSGQLTSGPMQANLKANTCMPTTATYCQYSTATQVSHSGTPSSLYTNNQHQSLLPQSNYPSVSCSSSLNSSFPMSTSLAKMRMNVNSMPIGQSDMAMAAQTLKQMAEQHQTKLSPTGNSVRSSLGDFGYNSVTAGSMMPHASGCVSNQMYVNNVNNSAYNPNIENEADLKRRQQMMQQYCMQQQTNQCNEKANHGLSPNMQSPPQTQLKSMQQQTQSPPSQQMAPLQSQAQPQQQQLSPQQNRQPQLQAQNQQNNQSPQLPNSLSPFSNRMSPINSYPQASSQMGMNSQYGSNMCGGVMSGGVRSSYVIPPRGSSPIPAVPQGQGQQSSMQNGAQPCYMQQPVMGNMNMMRSQMMTQPGQIMARPPPPEYRQTAIMQQHQAMMGQPMHQIPYQNMRPSFRPNMNGPAMGTMPGGQIMGTMNQQNIPANMKGPMVSANINISNSQGNMGQTGNLANNGMSVTMSSGSGGGNMAIINTRPTMLQRARTPNMNMGMPLGMATQMPPSRPEWRQMMMQQGQGGMIMGSGIRHGYQQSVMMNQSPQMMPMQRSQPNVMGMMNMQHQSALDNSGGSMQGTSNMSTSLQNNPNLQSGMPIGGRLQQTSVNMGQQTQMRIGMQVTQQGMSNTPPSMPQSPGASPGNLNPMGSPVGAMGQCGNSGVIASMSTMGTNISNLPHMSNMSQMGNISQMGGTGVNAMTQAVANNGSQVVAMNQSSGNMNAMALHPRSPAALGQMHPCSPAGSQSRPLSNPGLGISSSQSQVGSCQQPVSNSGSPLITCSGSQTLPRQNMGGSISSMGRNPNAMSQNQSPGLPQQTQSLTHPGVQNSLSNNPSVLMNKNVNSVASSIGLGGGSGQRPDSRGCSAMKTSQPSTPNPPSSSGSNDFDLIFNNEGEFASLLN